MWAVGVVRVSWCEFSDIRGQGAWSLRRAVGRILECERAISQLRGVGWEKGWVCCEGCWEGTDVRFTGEGLCCESEWEGVTGWDVQ